MQTKLQLITDLANQTAQNITKNAENWTSFLRTAAWNYKYSFAEQVLIYAQRPEATACAPIELWNEKLHRWVKKGSKGIALIDDRGDKLCLRYVFDVSDTEDRHEKPVYIWSIETRYEDAVIEAMESNFGELDSNVNIVDAIISVAQNAIEDNITDYIAELMNICEKSYLEELDKLNVMIELKQTLCSSVGYMLMERCGFGSDGFFEPDDFIYITDFNTLPTISLLGNARGICCLLQNAAARKNPYRKGSASPCRELRCMG